MVMNGSVMTTKQERLANKEKTVYTVYRLENIVTKKNYIGVTSREPKARWGKGYGGKMKEAIHSFPLDLCWKKHIEFQTPNREQALELEAELMKWYDSIENGYNSSEYGSGHYKRSEELKRKLSEVHTGEKHHMFGKHFSEEHRKHLSEAKGINGILQFSKDGELIAEYSSIMEAERTTGCNHICECCKGKRKSTGGYIWRYKL